MGVYERERETPRYLSVTTPVMFTGKLVRESAHRVLIGKWSIKNVHVGSLHITCIRTPGRRAGVYHEVCCLYKQFSTFLAGHVAPFLLSRFPDASRRSPLQAVCSKESHLSLLWYHVMCLRLALFVHTSRSVLHQASQ